MNPICDKCGLLVERCNDAVVIHSIAYNEPMTLLFYRSRHFMPVVADDGTVLCEGSPSRAQYIEGQPGDKRGYAYDTSMEYLWRAAYASVQVKE